MKKIILSAATVLVVAVSAFAFNSNSCPSKSCECSKCECTTSCDDGCTSKCCSK